MQPYRGVDAVQRRRRIYLYIYLAIVSDQVRYGYICVQMDDGLRSCCFFVATQTFRSAAARL